MKCDFCCWSLAQLAIPLLLLSIAEQACADFDLQVAVHSYSNPSHQHALGGCCDNKFRCVNPCDNYFLFCLRALGVTRGCPLGVFHSGEVGEDRLVFVPREGGRFGQLSNPLHFQNNGNWTGSFQLLIQVNDDDDFSGDEFVDLFAIARSLAVGTSFTSPETYVGVFGRGTIVLSFIVVCLEGYYGPDCGTLCVPRNDSDGHYSCDARGNRVCLEGYQGPVSNCTQCVTAEGCSSVGGYCEEPYECICHSGFTGEHCESAVDVCSEMSPCLNGGSCQTDAGGNLSCFCALGFTGSRCVDLTDETTPTDDETTPTDDETTSTSQSTSSSETTPTDDETTSTSQSTSSSETTPTDAETTPTDAETTPTDAETTPTDVETTPTDVEPTPTDVEPTPTDAETTPTDVEPTPTDAETTPTDVEPTPTDAETTPTDVEPTPTDAETTPTDVEPTPTDAETTPTAVEPTPTDVEPTPTDAETTPTDAAIVPTNEITPTDNETTPTNETPVDVSTAIPQTESPSPTLLLGGSSGIQAQSSGGPGAGVLAAAVAVPLLVVLLSTIVVVTLVLVWRRKKWKPSTEITASLLAADDNRPFPPNGPRENPTYIPSTVGVVDSIASMDHEFDNPLYSEPNMSPLSDSYALPGRPTAAERAHVDSLSSSTTTADHKFTNPLYSEQNTTPLSSVSYASVRGNQPPPCEGTYSTVGPMAASPVQNINYVRVRQAPLVEQYSSSELSMSVEES